jgi:hypothetical protein
VVSSVCGCAIQGETHTGSAPRCPHPVLSPLKLPRACACLDLMTDMPLHQPVIVSSCSHSFCGNCLSQYLRVSPRHMSWRVSAGAVGRSSVACADSSESALGSLVPVYQPEASCVPVVPVDCDECDPIEDAVCTGGGAHPVRCELAQLDNETSRPTDPVTPSNPLLRLCKQTCT